MTGFVLQCHIYDFKVFYLFVRFPKDDDFHDSSSSLFCEYDLWNAKAAKITNEYINKYTRKCNITKINA